MLQLDPPGGIALGARTLAGVKRKLNVGRCCCMWLTHDWVRRWHVEAGLMALCNFRRSAAEGVARFLIACAEVRDLTTDAPDHGRTQHILHVLRFNWGGTTLDCTKGVKLTSRIQRVCVNMVPPRSRKLQLVVGL